MIMNEKPQVDDIKYAHRGEGTSRRFTVAYKVDDRTKTVSYAYAFCSPRDNYNRRLGRTIASGRLLKGGQTQNGNDRVHVMTIEAIQHLAGPDVDVEQQHEAIADVLAHTAPWPMAAKLAFVGNG